MVLLFLLLLCLRVPTSLTGVRSSAASDVSKGQGSRQRQRRHHTSAAPQLRPGQARDALSMARRKSSLHENQQPGSLVNLEALDKLAQEFRSAGKKPSKSKEIEPAVESTDEEPGPNSLSPPPRPRAALSCVVVSYTHLTLRRT